MKIKFSLVTTCRNEMRSVSRWKQNILDQTRPPDEIVIVDAFSDDGTAEFLFAWGTADSRVKMFQEKGAAAHGRNHAIAHAKFEHILSTDMGVRLSENWCEELVKPFEKDPGVEIVAGNTCIDKKTVTSPAARAEYFIESGGLSKLGPGFIPGNRSVAYTKKVWRELDGLPEDLTFYADDSVFGRQMVQAGYKMAYAPKAMTYWGRPSDLGHFLKEQFNYGRGDGEADIKTPFAFRLYQKRMIPKLLVPFLTGLRSLQKHLKFSAVIQAVLAKDFSAMVLIPVFLFCRGFSFGKGYLIGDTHGRIHCQACRERLRRVNLN